jgi:hypothetical protein
MLYRDFNSQCSDLMEELDCHVVEIHWLALQFLHSEPQSLYEEIAKSGLFCKVFGVPEGEFLEVEDADELSVLITEHAGLGFLAKVFLNERTSFRMDWRGNMVGFNTSEEVGHLAYVYANTTEELVAKIERMANQYTESFFEEWKKTHEPPLSKGARKKRNRLLREEEAKVALMGETPTATPEAP